MCLSLLQRLEGDDTLLTQQKPETISRRAFVNAEPLLLSSVLYAQQMSEWQYGILLQQHCLQLA